MESLIIAIATLCAHPGVSPQEALKCQQYYVKCSRILVSRNSTSTALRMARCIEVKKALKGDNRG